MLSQLLAARKKGRTLEELRALAADLIAENDQLRLENMRLRKENRYLRHKLAEYEFRTLRRAEVDAALVGCMWLAGLPTSRRECEAAGISRRRWNWARALLQVGNVIDRRGWCVDDPAAFDARLAAGVRLVERDGMGRLRSYMPRDGYPGRKFPAPAVTPVDTKMTQFVSTTLDVRNEGTHQGGAAARRRTSTDDRR